MIRFFWIILFLALKFSRRWQMGSMLGGRLVGKFSRNEYICTISKNVHISPAVNLGNNFILINSETIGPLKKVVFTIAIDFSQIKLCMLHQLNQKNAIDIEPRIH